ncbi:MAG: hypothetical protein AAB453_04120 [Patescibacteria group bacterium]
MEKEPRDLGQSEGGEQTAESKEGVKIEWGAEASEPMDWLGTIVWCTNLGEGWRLPTSDELKTALENKTSGFTKNKRYWTSYMYANSRSWFGIDDNDKIIADYDKKDSKNYCRPVKD